MNKKKLFLIVLLSLFFAFTFRAYYQRIGAFGCFDDCFNIAAGYFISEGKTLYSEIFFNHQPLMAYVSFLIQRVFNPDTIYQLILYHRLFILAFSFLMDVLIIARFGLAGLGFAVLYEPTKFYVFGDRFLAEGLVVYPLVYLLGLTWSQFNKKTIFTWELVLAGLFVWLVIFLREPFIPVALVLYIFLLFEKKLSGAKLWSITTFILLSTFILLLFPIKDYIFNVITVNLAVEIKTHQILGLETLKMFFYPLYILIEHPTSHFGFILMGLSVVFLFLVVFYLKTGNWKKALVILTILGLTNTRVVEPGLMYYEAFHMAAWYGLFIITTLFLLSSLRVRPVLLFFIVIIGFSVLSPRSFFWERVDKDHEFTTNYANYYAYGTVIKALSSPKDTLFVDGFDELIHWQADLSSPYQYSFYTSVMPYFPLYTNAREEMFTNNPPDFYYGMCPGDNNAQRLMPRSRIGDYEQLYFDNKPTCLYVKRGNLGRIKSEQWEKIKELGFYLSPAFILQK